MELIRRNLSLLALLMLPGLHAAQTPQVGFVLEMKGDWLVNGKSIKGPGQGLPPGAVIEHNSKIKIRSGEELRITVVLLNNQSIPRTCNSVESCEKAQFNLPKSLIPESPFSERLSAARMRLLSRDPERYVPGLARSGDFKSAKLKDRVLLQPVIVSERNAECPGLAVSSLNDEPCMRPPSASRLSTAVDSERKYLSEFVVGAVAYHLQPTARRPLPAGRLDYSQRYSGGMWPTNYAGNETVLGVSVATVHCDISTPPGVRNRVRPNAAFRRRKLSPLSPS